MGGSTQAHAPSAVVAEAPEPFYLARDYAKLHARFLGKPAAAYLAVMPESRRSSAEALILLTDPTGDVGARLLRHAQDHGWAACIQSYADAPDARSKACGVGPLDGLLYRGTITAAEYWTGSFMFALWRDCLAPPTAADATLPDDLNAPVRFGGRYVDWDNVTTYDCSQTTSRQALCKAAYGVAPSSRERHDGLLAQPLAALQHSPERFAYLFPMVETHTFPWFSMTLCLHRNLSPWQLATGPWQAETGARQQLPVGSLSMYQLDLNLFKEHPLQAAVRVGADRVSTMQAQIINGQRPAGLSHPLPWSAADTHLHADHMPTGEAGFAWHDITHLLAASSLHPEARSTLVQLHQHLSAFGRSLGIPERVGRFPLRRLVLGNLFALTDQSRGCSTRAKEGQIGEYIKTTLARSLSEFLESSAAVDIAHVRTTLLPALETDHVYSYKVSGLAHAMLGEKLRKKLRLYPTGDLQKLNLRWAHYTHLLLAEACTWLAQRGYQCEQIFEWPIASSSLIKATRPLFRKRWRWLPGARFNAIPKSTLKAIVKTAGRPARTPANSAHIVNAYVGMVIGTSDPRGEYTAVERAGPHALQSHGTRQWVPRGPLEAWPLKPE